MSAYLFVHFTGDHKDGEQVYFSMSQDGLFWKDLNKGNPVLYSRIGELGVRDPFIVRDPKNKKYYIIATDLRIGAGKGWGVAQYAGSRSIIVWESEDLVHWSEERSCLVGVEGAGCVWAPEAIYLPEEERFFVFFASMVKLEGDAEPRQRIYGTYTKDFREFSETFLYMEKQKHVIDTTMVKDGDTYYRFTKDETNSRILFEKGDSITGEFEKINSEVLENLAGVEGPECYLLPDGKTWCLIVDQFAACKGYLPLLTENLSSGEFTVLRENLQSASDGECQEEMTCEMARGTSNTECQEGIPTKPQYYMGKNEKRHGGVIQISDEEYQRLKDAFGEKNPVINGLYADPDLAFFNGKYYLYPTSDGFTDWSGTTFSVFSSEDGLHFKDEGQILDLASEQVPWAVGSAWAPCIAYKNNKYYFYFCGKNKFGTSCIGVAVSDSPTGPFVAEANPLLSLELMAELGISMGQTIDPSIYMEGDEVYLLFGNGVPAIVKLTEDMVHIQVDTLARLEGAYDFREAITVLKRGGLYHFTWSCDDTRSADYHVNYGTSKNLYGPITFEKTILERDELSLGTGHHSILKLPGEDKYKIAYHRFGTPVEKYVGGNGYNREVCIGDVEFDEAGKMRVVK